jgi:putative ABC transport system permease protein
VRADAVVRADGSVRLGEDTLTVARPRLLPAGAPARVRAVAGVGSATGDVAFPLTVLGAGATAHAHGWPSASLTGYRLIAGHEPTGPGDVVLDAGLAGRLRPGDRVRVVTPGGAADVRLAGVTDRRGPPTVFFTQAQAQMLSGLGRGFNAIAVRARPGVDVARLRDAVGRAVGSRARVLDHRHAAEGDAGDPSAFDRTQLVATVAAGGGITLAIAIFVAAGAIAVAVARRRRDVALLRAVGATPGRVRWMLLRATGLLGMTAGVTGCVVATAMMGPVVDALRSVDLAPPGFSVTPIAIPYAIAIGAGTAVALLGALVASRRTLAVRPGEALVETALPERRLGVVRAAAGLIALGGGVALVITLHTQALSFATLSAFCFMIGVALLAPVMIGWPVALAGRMLRTAGGAGFLAGSSLATGRFRVGTAAAATALVVALAGTQVVSLATAKRATQRATAARVHAEHVLVARAGGGLPPSVARAAARIPGVTVAAMVATEVYLPDPGLLNQGDGWRAAGLDPLASTATLDLDVRRGTLRTLGSGDVAVSETVARRGRLTVGSTLRVRLADATPARLRVTAVYRRANGLGDVVLPRALALAHATAPLDDAVFVAGHRRTMRDGLDAVTRSTPTVAILTRRAYLDAVDTQTSEDAHSQWVIDTLMILIATMAAFNAGATAAAERRRELGLARLVGARRAQVMRSVTLESALATLAGTLVGGAVALISLSGAESDPAGGPLAIPSRQTVLVLGGAAVLGLAAALLPATLIHRSRLAALVASPE